jgi:hypothetical protein
VQLCHVCPNQTTFAGCTALGAPQVECGAEACVQAGCSSLDEANCMARTDCQPGYCCGASHVYAGCTPAGVAVTCAIACPAPAPCAGLDEAACQGRSDCQTESCPTCNGGPAFAGCTGAGEPPVQCPAACLGAPCSELTETLCKGRVDCTPDYCPDCTGGQTFAGCAALGSGTFACAASCQAPPPCDGLDETSCQSRNDCHVGYCSICGQTFAGCVGPNEAVACPTYACPVLPTPCADVTDKATCDGRPDCHSVFVDPGTCDCAVAGCCTHFAGCADGGQAACRAPSVAGGMICDRLPPVCSAPAYVISYTADCYEGCVPPTECSN